jgi:GTPase
MSSFSIAIVGRPNVGKSTLFNRLVKQRRAIVAKESGVTRDYQIKKAYWKDYGFDVIDTSGFEVDRHDQLRTLINEQYDELLDNTEAFLFLCDGQEPLTQLDYDLLGKIRKTNKPFIGVVNKADTTYFRSKSEDYHSFFGKDYESISAERGERIAELLETLEKQVKLPEGKKEIEPHRINVVIMGRPNAGKSTLLNELTSKNRSLVSPLAGTTRDPVDTEVQVDDATFVFVDTAGLRKRANITERVEAVSASKAVLTLDRSDLLLLVIDATQGPREQDKRIASLAWKRGVGILIVINKWDLLPDEKRRDTYWQRLMKGTFRGYNKIPFLFVSATEKRNTQKVFAMVKDGFKSYEQVINGETLKDHFNVWTQERRAPMKKEFNRRIPIRFYQCRQSNHKPPVFEIITNYPKDIDVSYDNYLKNKIRETFGFWGTPIVIRYKRVN